MVKKKIVWKMAFLFFGGFIVMGCSTEKFRDNTNEIVYVGDVPIVLDELVMSMVSKKSEIVSLFVEKYGLTQISDFWNKEYGGERTFDKLKEAAIKDAVNRKMKQILLKKRGFKNAVGYDDFLSEYSDENNRRKEQIKLGNIIYGLKKFDKPVFMKYTLSNHMIALRNEIIMGEINLNEEVVEKAYENLKDTLFKKAKVVTVKMVSAQGRSDTTYYQTKFKSILNDTTLINGDFCRECLFETLIFKEENNRSYSELYGPIADAVQSMKPGQLSTIQLDQYKNSCFMVKCVATNDVGYRPYSEVSHVVKRILAEERIDQLLEDIKKDYPVYKNNKLINSISPDILSN